VADDEPQIGALVREALATHGYAADVVTDGASALQKILETEYVAAVVDVFMPVKTGAELAHELRVRGIALPIVLMSSHLSQEVLNSCGMLEHLSFLQKPFGLNDLRLAVQRAIATVPA
jgi:two-component system response regulator AtoC